MISPQGGEPRSGQGRARWAFVEGGACGGVARQILQPFTPPPPQNYILNQRVGWGVCVRVCVRVILRPWGQWEFSGAAGAPSG